MSEEVSVTPILDIRCRCGNRQLMPIPRGDVIAWECPICGATYASRVVAAGEELAQGNTSSAPSPASAPVNSVGFLTVHYLDGQFRSFRLTQGWKVDVMHRMLVIGRGIPRTVVPLDTVKFFELEGVGSCDE